MYSESDLHFTGIMMSSVTKQKCSTFISLSLSSPLISLMLSKENIWKWAEHNLILFFFLLFKILIEARRKKQTPSFLTYYGFSPRCRIIFSNLYNIKWDSILPVMIFIDTAVIHHYPLINPKKKIEGLGTQAWSFQYGGRLTDDITWKQSISSFLHERRTSWRKFLSCSSKYILAFAASARSVSLKEDVHQP